jgi:hypothetical protein
MFAQVSEETAKSFLDRVPDIIRAAATNPLGLVALIVLVLGILAYFLLRNTKAKIKLSALVVVAVCVVVLALVAIRESGRMTTAAGCKVSGFVYNEDPTPAVGLQNVRLAFLAAHPANPRPVSVATTAPDGSFSFNCSQIRAEAFPIHLQASFSMAGNVRIIESEDQLVFGENQEVNLYVSLRAISNHYRLSKEIMRVPSAQLFRHNFVTVTNAATTARASTNKLLAIPRSVRLPKETITRLRAAP